MSKATNVTAVLIEGADKQERCKQIPGSFFYYWSGEKETGIIQSCPCGCGNLGNLNLKPTNKSPSWANSGTRDKPTLSPSVGIKKYREDQDVEPDGFHWHGYLVDGVWKSCN